MFSLADRLRSIQPSPTLALNARAAALKAEGIDVINLAAGEPDFETPGWIQESAIQAMKQGLTKYTAVDGIQPLKKAIQEKFRRDNDLEYTLDEITVANGGKQILFNAMMASLNTGDEVIIPAPYWVSYPDVVRMFGGVDVIVPCTEETGFKLTPEALRQAITKRTKWVILNSPSNPTGSVYSKEELKSLADVLSHYPNIYILSDDIYEHLIYGDVVFYNIVQVEPHLKNQTLILNGVSKSYSMTGWRIGYGVGPQTLIRAMNLIQSQSTSNACSIAQGGAVMAVNGPQEFLNDWRQIFAERRDKTLQALNQVPGLNCLRPDGAFYLYVNCQGVLGRQTPSGKILETDNQFCAYLLDAAKVTAVSGDAFGLSPYFRISYATSLELLQEACRRIQEAVLQLR
ncbi:pyridoxal phosphate-dependent aminotransferase [Candidatus Finniella inopinata]|uniref:Aminotransferase n=1 Tax=Candidatus Finniella inopinata TaxID=1696036 RepID=A0A4Q7DL30_9PROT|nr:pyridoxal phosphate-dependent aminotransferase [Candidatus Finniella inopinata]RZI46945.1 pyridoxal phosphate-dependent aminotransferase [Candidatus Finniella inopinata]